MDNNISFEAFDFELSDREIDIPDEFKATIKDNKIIFKKKESEDEKIRKELIKFFKFINEKRYIAWLEKQISWDKALIEAKKYEALFITKFIDKNTQSGTFLNTMECKDLYNAVINDDWQKVYDYMKKKLEKPDERL